MAPYRRSFVFMDRDKEGPEPMRIAQWTMKAAMAAAVLVAAPVAPAMAQDAAPGADGPLKVENYYRVKWGGMAEFLRVYHKQHEALLREMMRQGFITEVTVEMPFTHMGGSTRWDVRATIVYKHGADGVGAGAAYKAAMAAAKARMFPDKAAFEAEELKRQQVIEDHWDEVIEPAP
ncbi:hypothetical protein [Novosphingobium album (ex Hu et al. 2023)]|uniref:Uncharacterized protein n=1 Tax=Novosphingobium album (ex Hu et al. 2023) TaxID=2930093 RepID=A0ABT0B3X8_9SPHN|nr:hypothetical protein [Novosphingobium album (ex Hu et al. 2023)]MCJ2179755.1 hypothetical protein [Novosphingobium album (ex Hu et al. 2023)]